MQISMAFIDAQRLVNLAIENNIVRYQDDFILMEFEDGSNEAITKDKFTQMVMRDRSGQQYIMYTLKNIGIEFKTEFTERMLDNQKIQFKKGIYFIGSINDFFNEKFVEMVKIHCRDNDGYTFEGIHFGYLELENPCEKCSISYLDDNLGESKDIPVHNKQFGIFPITDTIFNVSTNELVKVGVVARFTKDFSSTLWRDGELIIDDLYVKTIK